jgi:hypothetical protein
VAAEVRRALDEHATPAAGAAPPFPGEPGSTGILGPVGSHARG